MAVGEAHLSGNAIYMLEVPVRLAFVVVHILLAQVEGWNMVKTIKEIIAWYFKSFFFFESKSKFCHCSHFE